MSDILINTMDATKRKASVLGRSSITKRISNNERNCTLKKNWINQITSGVLLTKRHRFRHTLSVISGHLHKSLNHGNFGIVATDATVSRRTRIQKSSVRSIILSKRGRKQLMNDSYYGYFLCLMYVWVIIQRTPTPRNNADFLHTERTTVEIHRSSNQRHEQ